jgi:hypothetical protein
MKNYLKSNYNHTTKHPLDIKGNWRGSIRTKKEEFYVHVFICVWNGEKRLSLYKNFMFEPHTGSFLKRLSINMIWLLSRDNGNRNNKTKKKFN